MPRGRPREFDCDKALNGALAVFWRKGYQGASMADLTRAMGVNRPSLYAAFGNKEALFRKVLDRYAEGPAAFALEALSEPTARRVVERLLQSAADAQTDPRKARGCLMVQSALSSGPAAETVRRELAARRIRWQTALRQRLERAKREHDLPAAAKPADLASYVATVMHGMAVQAASGASRDVLRRVAKTALRAWPA